MYLRNSSRRGKYALVTSTTGALTLLRDRQCPHPSFPSTRPTEEETKRERRHPVPGALPACRSTRSRYLTRKRLVTSCRLGCSLSLSPTNWRLCFLNGGKELRELKGGKGGGEDLLRILLFFEKRRGLYRDSTTRRNLQIQRIFARPFSKDPTRLSKTYEIFKIYDSGSSR